MAKVTTQWKPLHAFVRWRPMSDDEASDGEMTRVTQQEANSLYSISICHPSHRSWKSAGAFKETCEPADTNRTVFETVVVDAIPKVLQGAYCNFFAYGHTGSGKTHTMIGYDYEDDDRVGLCLAAAKQVFVALENINREPANQKLGIGFSLFELRKNVAFDLLNDRNQCHIRQGADGKTHIRGETEMLEDELEIINEALVQARKARDDRQSELVPVGKRATDIIIGESMKSLIKNDDGTYSTNPDYTKREDLIEAAEAEQAEYESRVAAAENYINSILSSTDSPACLGGKLVIVDLAGSEYQQDRGAPSSGATKQTPQERMEGRQINTDLLALKEVIRACSTNQSRIPFRSSPLTMVLRDHFLGSKNGSSAMIVTASPSNNQYLATLNSLKYGSLVGAASA